MSLIVSAPICVFPEYEVTQKTVEWAKRRAAELPPLANSILNGGGVVPGFIGQAICAKHMGAKRADEKNYHFDIFHSTFGRLEVKTTQCSTAPEPRYNCHVALSNDKQRCDAYAFMRVNYTQTKAWFMGWMPKGDFEQWRFKLLKGEKDADGWPVPADCWNIRGYQLYTYPDTRLIL